MLFDIGAEAFAVDWAVEDARRRELVAAQGAEESQRPPVATRHQAPHPITLGPPSAQRSHVGLDPSFVDKHQPFRIETRLPRAPALPSPRDVGASLFKGEQRFF